MINEWIAATQLAEKHHPDGDGWRCIILKHAEEVLGNVDGAYIISVVTCSNESRS
jgi:hypothetical protein